LRISFNHRWTTRESPKLPLEFMFLAVQKSRRICDYDVHVCSKEQIHPEGILKFVVGRGIAIHRSGSFSRRWFPRLANRVTAMNVFLL
jgi:hypothetical protein